MGRLSFKGGKGGSLCVCVCVFAENGSLLYTSQQDFGPGCGLVSSVQRGAFLSCLPRGGAPATASNSGQKDSLVVKGGGWDGKMLGGSRKLTCAEVMKSSGRVHFLEKRGQHRL